MVGIGDFSEDFVIIYFRCIGDIKCKLQGIIFFA